MAKLDDQMVKQIRKLTPGPETDQLVHNTFRSKDADVQPYSSDPITAQVIAKELGLMYHVDDEGTFHVLKAAHDNKGYGKFFGGLIPLASADAYPLAIVRAALLWEAMTRQ